MLIRHATLSDVPLLAAVERECFPPLEAATPESLEERVATYPQSFWLLFDENKLISFVDGMITDTPDLADNMYEQAKLHQENGCWQMIFGVNTIPAYRKQGNAAQTIRAAIAETRVRGLKGLVLTCKKELIPYYAKFGFINEGISKSVHGNVVWYQMRLTF